jgi:hypothetical protein
MKTLTETADLLIVEDDVSKNLLKKYVILFTLILIIIVIVANKLLDTNYGGIALIWMFILVIIVDAVIFPTTSKIKAIVDKKNNALRLFENDREQSVSDYPLTEIKNIKTLLTSHHSLLTKGANNRTSLVAVLKNNQTHTLISSGLAGAFYIDVEANKQAKIGRKIAEFLGVPFQEEYNPPII